MQKCWKILSSYNSVTTETKMTQQINRLEKLGGKNGHKDM